MGIAHKVHEAQEKKGLTDKTLLTTHVAGDSAGRAAHPDLRGGGHGDPGAERGQLH